MKKMGMLLEKTRERLRDGKSTLKGYCKEAANSRIVIDSHMESRGRRRVESKVVSQWRKWKQLSEN